MVKRFFIFILIAAMVTGYFLLPPLKTANALDVANGDGLIVYGQSANTTPQWRTYGNTANSFGAAGATVANATGLTFIVRTSPTKQEAVAGYVTSGGVLQVMCYNGASWTNEWTATVGGTGTTRGFDISYETNSGDAIVLYSGNVATTNELRFRTKAGTVGCGSANWSVENNLDPVRTSGTVRWVKMAWDKRSTSNLIAAIWADSNSDLSAMIWSGTAWANEPAAALEISLEVAAAAQDVDDFAVQYESTSGDVMVTWANSAGANGTNGVRYATCTGGTSTCTWGAVTTPPTFADDATNLDLCSNPNSDEMVFASIGNAGSDLQIGYWSGSAWTNTANVDTSSATPLAGTKLVACGWLISGATTRSVVAYNDNAATNIGWQVGNGSTFTVQADFTPTPAFGSPQKQYDIQTDPINKDRLMFTLSDLNSDLFAKRLIMTATPAFTWTNADGGAALEVNLAQATVGDFSFAYWRFIPAPTFNQSAYRLFNNIDSTDVGTALAAQDTAATLGSTGAAFRSRMLIHVDVNQLIAGGQAFKLQFAQQSGTCDTGFVGETYADVTAATVIAYNDNPNPLDGEALFANANDPTHGADTIVNQAYAELNNFTNLSGAIPSGQDGKWDFSLKDNGATASTAYCFRAVKSDNTVLNTYTVIPQITTAAAAPTQTLTFSLGANSLTLGTLSTTAVTTGSHTITVGTNAANGVAVTYSGATLTFGANTITACAANCTSTAGTEQFGVNAVANTAPAVGAACSGTTPIASAATNYATANSFRFVSGETIVSSTGSINDTTCTISYIANISGVTAAGSYSATLTYVATATF